MKFGERIIGMIIKPDETTKDISNEPRIEEALVIVGVYAILSMLSAYISSTHIKLIYNIPEVGQLSGIQTIVMLFTIIGSLLWPLIVWPVVTGILHIFAMMYGGNGKFYPQMMTVIGYTGLVKIFAVVISMLLLTQAPIVTLEITQQGLSTSVQGVASDFYSSPFYLASTIVSLLGLLWSCVLGVFAIKNGEKLNITSATIIVGISLAVYLILTYGFTFILRLLGF